MIPVLILGSSRGIRYLDAYKSYPTALKKIHGSESALSWNLAALEKAGLTYIIYVGGYHMEKVVQQHPELHYVFHGNWEKEGPVNALFCVEKTIANGGLIISADMVFNHEAIGALTQSQSDVVIGIEPLEAGTDPGANREPLIPCPQTGKKVRFSGLLKCTKVGVDQLLERARRRVAKELNLDMHELVSQLIEEHKSIDLVDLSGKRSSLKRPMAVSQFILGSKAQTLERLQGVLKKGRVLDQVRFTVKEWQANRNQILQNISTTLKSECLVVRSSSLAEDGWSHSNAGRFRSVLDVNACSLEAITAAIDDVADSYRQSGESNELNQIFVQPQVDSAAMSGVILTRDLETHAPYYIITYHVSSKTDSVTSGNDPGVQTVLVYKNGNLSSSEETFLAHIEKAEELEFLMGYDSLDIEFAFDTEGELYVLQVRPIATKKNKFIPTDEDFDLEIREARDFLNHTFQQNTNLLGKSTLLSNMSDWNPAEMIGTNPRPLALSLYQFLITDRTWAKARAAVKYRDTYPSPLLLVVSGQPYIDLRASFNSFIPAKVSADTAEKCVNGYLEYLARNPELHDKVEFEVAVTCMTFDFEHHAQRLQRMGLDDSEIDEMRLALVELTDNLISQKTISVDEQLNALKIMSQRRENQNKHPNSKVTLPMKVSQLLNDCARYGTLPFSILARNGFISLAILRSLKTKGILSEKEFEKCLHIPTIATEVSRAMRSVLNETIAEDDFLSKFGHLRPGTYDILSPNYRQASAIYLNLDAVKPSESNEPSSEEAAAKVFESKFSQIQMVLNEYGFKCSPRELQDFIFASIKGREYAKFEFTKNIDLVLEYIVELGEYWGLDYNQLSYFSIQDILKWASDSQHCALPKKLKRGVKFEEKRYVLNNSVKLPHIITDPNEIEWFELTESKPNFITSKTLSAEVVVLEQHMDKPLDLRGKIVAIRGADPGFDWIFVHNIGGLITQYGGVGSHMSIRAAEFGLPAAIGCGEIIYERVREANIITLDCAGQQIKIIN